MGPDYQRCRACGHVQYFERPFCGGCGEGSPDTARSSGRGRIAAVTMLHRAPSRAMADRVPYEIVLVDMEEGFRVMAAGPGGSEIGQAVAVETGADGLLAVVGPSDR